MPTNFNDAQTEPDVAPSPPPVPPLGPTIPWDPNATQTAAGQPGQPPPYSPTIPYPGPYAPPAGGGPFAPPGAGRPPMQPTAANPSPAYPVPAPQQWPGGASPIAPTVVNPQPAPRRAPHGARDRARQSRRPSPLRVRRRVRCPPPLRRRRACPRPPRPRSGSGGCCRCRISCWVWDLFLLMAALNIPWGATAGGTLVYAQSFSIPFFSDQPDVASQLAQDVVTSAGLLSLALAGLNYLLTGMNWLARPIGVAGCATALFMPLMLCLMFLLLHR